MTKRVILITGTPCVGKTSAAQALTAKLVADYVNLTELATKENLITGKDEKRDSIIIDETRMKRRIHTIIENSDKDVIIDGHYAVSVVPEKLVTHVFVLRKDPAELRKTMQKCNFPEAKLYENLASEILDVCLFEAVKAHGTGKVCEINATDKNVEQVVSEVLEILNGNKKCRVGIVDWLGKLETEGTLNEYLKI